MFVRMKGLAKVKVGKRTYWYAWRGGPRVRGEYGTPEFRASYDEAVAERRIADDGRFSALVRIYKASPAYQGLALSTRRQWAPWLDRIGKHFGTLSIAQFDRSDKVRPFIRRWRDKFSATPRTADYGMQVLSRVLAHGVEIGRLSRNPCEGIKPLYSTDRSDRIWTKDDLARIKSAASAEIGSAIDLAAATGLRLGDLLRLSWSHIGEHEIVIVTGKSGKRLREAVIPLHDELRSVLAGIKRRSPVILTNSRGRPWTTDGFGSSFNKAKIKAGMKSADDLNFHDLRGTAATRFYVAGLPERVIAEIMGWEEAHVARIIRRYVGRAAATQAAIIALRGTFGAQTSAKNAAKPAGK